MRTEYMLTNEQKKEIALIEQQIIDLHIKKSKIYLMAPVRYVPENEEEIAAMRRLEYERCAILGHPFIKNDAIVKITTDESRERVDRCDRYEKEDIK